MILQRSDRQALNGEILGLMESILLTIFSIKQNLRPTKLSMLLEIFLGNAATPYLKRTRPVMNSYALRARFLQHIDFQQNDWYTAAQATDMVIFEPNSVDQGLLRHLCDQLVFKFDSHLQVGLGAHHGEAIDLLR